MFRKDEFDSKGLESLVSDMPIKLPGAVGVFGAVYETVQRSRAAGFQHAIVIHQLSLKTINKR
jgi:hypothetical protein